MKRVPDPYWIALLIAGLLLPALAYADAMPDDPARLAPAGTSLFLSVDDLGQLREQWGAGPVMEELKGELPARRNPEAWATIQLALGMPGPEIIDTYFDRQLVLIGSQPGSNQPGVLLTEADPEDVAYLLAQPMLELQNAGQAGGFKLHLTGDGKTLIGTQGGWIALTAAKHMGYLQQVLADKPVDQSLAGDAEYRKWNAMLPADAPVRAFLRRPAEGAVHALAGEFNATELTVHYAGRPKRGGMEKVGDARSLSCDVVPSEAWLSLSLNIDDDQPEAEHVDGLNRLLAPKNFTTDIAPKLEAPVAMFLTTASPAWLGQAAADVPDGARLPAFGWAVKLNDPAVAKDLTRMLDRGLLFLNVAAVRRELPALSFHNGQHQGVSYRRVKVGPTIAARLRRPNLAELDIAYGRIGDWYVLTTFDELFQQCVAAQGAGEPMPRAVREDAGRPLVAATLRVPEANLVLDSVVKLWQDNPPTLPNLPAWRANRLAALRRAVLRLSQAADLYEDVSLSIAQPDPERVAFTGEFSVRRRQPAEP